MRQKSESIMRCLYVHINDYLNIHNIRFCLKGWTVKSSLFDLSLQDFFELPRVI